MTSPDRVIDVGKYRRGREEKERVYHYIERSVESRESSLGHISKRDGREYERRGEKEKSEEKKK